MAEKRPALPLLTSLRFFAAANVVAFHYSPHVPTDFLRGLVDAGPGAVTFFFVLSGFILTYVYADKAQPNSLSVSAREFWRARIARIWPAYVFGLALALPHYLDQLTAHEIRNDLFVTGLILVPTFLQAWWAPAAMLWNVPAWSVSVEFFFYALFPYLARPIMRINLAGLFVVACGMALGVTALKAAILMPGTLLHDIFPDNRMRLNFIEYFPPLFLPQLVFGIAMARLFLWAPNLPQWFHTFLLAVSGGAILALFGLHLTLPDWVMSDAVLVPLFALIIFGGARIGRLSELLANPFLILLGEASYSTYILHVPLQYWWTRLIQGELHLKLPEPLDFALFFALVIAVSILSYRLIETPLRRLILGHREHRPA